MRVVSLSCDTLTGPPIHLYHLNFSQSDYLIRIVAIIHIHNGKQCRSRSVGFFRSQLIWICTVCKCRVYPVSAGQGLIKTPICIPTSFFFLFIFWQKQYMDWNLGPHHQKSGATDHLASQTLLFGEFQQ